MIIYALSKIFLYHAPSFNPSPQQNYLSYSYFYQPSLQGNLDISMKCLKIFLASTNFPILYPLPHIQTLLQQHLTFQDQHLYQFPSVAITNYYKLSSLKKNVFFHISGGQESKTKCQQGWFSSGVRETFQLLVTAGNPWHSLAHRSTIRTSESIFTWPFPLCFSVLFCLK